MAEESTRPVDECATQVKVTERDYALHPNAALSKVNSHSSQDAHVRSRSPDNLSLVSADGLPELQNHTSGADVVERVHGLDLLDEEKVPSKTARWKSAGKQSWIRNKGVALVIISQVFGILMSVTTRLLEENTANERGLNPLQIIFARMSITLMFAVTYMWYNKVEHFPFGAPGLRILLICRGVGGFFGVFGLYYSLQYIPLADATVLTFLGPPLACYICSKILKEPFTRTEQIAALISLAGVVLIARPTALFHHGGDSSRTHEDSTNTTRDNSSSPHVSSRQRMAAVGMAMVGVLGAAVAYTTIRWIGKRAHPLISVSYLAAWCTIVSTTALLFITSVPFVLPHSWRQWFLLFFIGISGFVMQFLLTAGLAYEKSSRANNMVYIQMVFALIADLSIWGQVPSLLSIGGSTLILGGAIAVAIQKGQTTNSGPAEKEIEEEQEHLMHEAEQMEAGSAENVALELQDVSSPTDHDVALRTRAS